MKRWTLALLTAAVVSIASVPVFAQGISPEHRDLRSRIEAHYEVVPSSDAIALVPKTRDRDVRLIDISQGVIAINGVTVTGKELRERLGSDADLIVRLSYLTAEERRDLFTLRAEADPQRDRRSATDQNRQPRPRRSNGERIRIFGDVNIDEEESIGGEAVAILGSVRVNGEVGQEVVAVLGSVELGPKANVRGDVVSVGGRVRRAPSAQVSGSITEISLGDAGVRLNAPWVGPVTLAGFDEVPRLFLSTFRLLLLLLIAGIAYVIARGTVEGSAQRAIDNAPKALLVGLAAELLFAPVLVLTAILLAISIVGIPLLLLLPFAVLVLVLLALAGFAGTAAALGQGARRRFALGGEPGFLDIVLGVVIILSPLLLGRMLGLVGGGSNPFGWLLILTGTAFEFLAWTTGFGAVLMNTFSRWRARRVTAKA
jgi:hypothetical protein